MTFPDPLPAIRISRRVLLGAAPALLPLGAARSLTRRPARSRDDEFAPPPRGAVHLFDGTSTDAWRAAGSDRPCPWHVVDGVLEVAPGTGNIETAARFDSFRLHVEFNIPNMPDAHSQGKGNSGVYLQGLYEIQVLDSYNNETYANGMCGAVYGQHPPLINACRPAGEWQSYDIDYEAPVFRGNEVARRPAVTVFHNGNLIHDHAWIEGATVASGSYNRRQAGPIMLQDHGSRVRYRNVWIVPGNG